MVGGAVCQHSRVQPPRPSRASISDDCSARRASLRTRFVPSIEGRPARCVFEVHQWGGLQGIGGIETNTLSVAEGIAGAVEWTLAQHGNAGVISVNAVVGAVAT
jgi:hypothetical protein